MAVVNNNKTLKMLDKETQYIPARAPTKQQQKPSPLFHCVFSEALPVHCPLS